MVGKVNTSEEKNVKIEFVKGDVWYLKFANIIKIIKQQNNDGSLEGISLNIRKNQLWRWYNDSIEMIGIDDYFRDQNTYLGNFDLPERFYEFDEDEESMCSNHLLTKEMIEYFGNEFPELFI